MDSPIQSNSNSTNTAASIWCELQPAGSPQGKRSPQCNGTCNPLSKSKLLPCWVCLDLGLLFCWWPWFFYQGWEGGYNITGDAAIDTAPFQPWHTTSSPWCLYYYTLYSLSFPPSFSQLLTTTTTTTKLTTSTRFSLDATSVPLSHWSLVAVFF